MAGFQGGYKVDIAFVIDATGSMEPIMTEVKERALTLGDEIKEKMEASGRHVGALRIRVIDFGDFATESIEAIRTSEFFNMPEEQPQFENQVRGIQYADRGGDVPENALEALWVAMKSDWVDLPGLTPGRHIIVLITDAPPLNLGERTGCMGYVADDYPENIQEMEEIWKENSTQGGGHTKLNPKKKRLLLFAPEGDVAGHNWDAVSGWENTTYTPVDPANGLKDMPLDGVIAEIVRSL